MSLIQKLAEEKIRSAIDNGELDDLPGRGKPLVLDDNSAVPEELRAAYRLLKNSGYLPPDLKLRVEIGQVEDLVRQAESAEEADGLTSRLNLLRSRLAKAGRESSLAAQEQSYREKIAARLASRSGVPDDNP